MFLNGPEHAFQSPRILESTAAGRRPGAAERLSGPGASDHCAATEGMTDDQGQVRSCQVELGMAPIRGSQFRPDADCNSLCGSAAGNWRGASCRASASIGRARSGSRSRWIPAPGRAGRTLGKPVRQAGSGADRGRLPALSPVANPCCFVQPEAHARRNDRAAEHSARRAGDPARQRN